MLKYDIHFYYIMYCFRFFKAVNSKEGKLKVKRRSFLLNDADLIGLDYLWRVSLNHCSHISLVYFDWYKFQLHIVRQIKDINNY